MAKSKKKATTVKVDFKGVEGKRSTLPDDDYLVEVTEVELKEGSKAEYFEITMEVQSGPHKGSKIWDRASTSPNALWRLRSLLEVMGIEVPDGPLELDPDDLVGTSFIAVTAQEGYKNDDGEKKVAVRLVDFYKADEESAEDEEDEEEEKPKSKKDKKAGKGKKSKDEDEDDAEDEDAEADEDEETPEERKKRLRKERREKRNGGGKASKDADEDEEDEPAPKKGKGKKSKDEDEDEDDEPKAKKGKKADKKSKKKSKVSSDDVMDADEDGLQELIDEHELDVDLDDFKTLRKKAAAVIDALEEADLLEE